MQPTLLTGIGTLVAVHPAMRTRDTTRFGRSIEPSAAAVALHPSLATLAVSGDPTVPALRVGIEGEAADVVVAQSTVPRLSFDRDGRLTLAFAAPDAAFARALIGAAALPDGVPAGDGRAMRGLLDLAARVADSAAGVLIAGPTGSGKEGLARFVHARSRRRAGPFVGVNCAAIPDTMLEATLFGTERGAFTGATAPTLGLFRAASSGTLLLDEVSELPLGLQAKLLRALQEREVLPVGSTQPVAVDTRIIATTNRDLASEVAAGRFRADLYYRLAVFPLTTSALVARAGDIPAVLAALWLRRGVPAWPTAAALDALMRHSWPGNVRELDNIVARAAILAADGLVGLDALMLDTVRPALPGSLGNTVRWHEHERIRHALAACAGNRAATARELGISERTLRYKLAAMPDAGAMLQ